MSHDRAMSFETYLQEQLFERRVVLAQGELDVERATNVSAQLLTLEALADEPIRLHLASPGGELGAVLGLADAIGMLGVELTVVATGEVGGAALAAYAAAPVRLAYPHARFALTEPDGPAFDGPATQLESLAEEHLRRHHAYVELLAEATGRQPDAIADDLRRKRYLTVSEAVGYGLVTSVETEQGRRTPPAGPPAAT